MVAEEQSSPLGVLTEAISQLQAGILTTFMLRFQSRLEAPALLAASILSDLICEPPFSSDAARFQEANAGLVEEAVQEVAEQEDLADPLSYLYAAKTLQLVFITKSPLSDQAVRLGDRASELGIYIPNTYDLCGSGDAVECINAILEFAKAYAQQAFGR
ncbi:MAG TPA: hypothetical protein VHE60_17960 [Pyrinomonadaceae bacterium]|nr:hypothetical protein [Pyrinomonadaceae bacterium]